MIRYKLKNATRHQSDVLHHPERLNQATPILDDKDSTGSPAQGVEGVSTAQFSFLPPLTNFDFITNPIQNHISISRVEPFWFLHRRHNRAHGNESPIPIPPPPENDPEYQNDPTPQPVSELQSPVNLLTKCHTMSVTLASIGFILALVGILTFVWKALPQDVSIFATASLGVCALAGIIALS
ncbi:hypothetical protein NLI96_g9396 [Meripilus lineatus]|uniref:Uncharacterized protein n=1 Tax=Meripilus lineatus TaxID=2056292 RepID=A0AAD5UVJ0_9APHY|nr:hypothetical protein NLI96_g9396 [Physisporinus lineatus]